MNCLYVLYTVVCDMLCVLYCSMLYVICYVLYIVVCYMCYVLVNSIKSIVTIMWFPFNVHFCEKNVTSLEVS